MTLDDVSFTVEIAYISRATLDSERHWTPVVLGIGSIVWAPKRLRGYRGEQSSAYPPTTIQRRALAKWGPSMHEPSDSLSSSPRSIAHSSTVKAAPTASQIFPARFPKPLTEYDRNGLTNFNLVGLASTTPLGIAISTCFGPAGWAFPPRRSQGLVWVDLRPSPKALSWMGLCPTPKALL